jgi:hypothetical protein
MTASFHQPGDPVIVRRLKARSIDSGSGGLGKHSRRGVAREGRLSYTLGPCK